MGRNSRIQSNSFVNSLGNSVPDQPITFSTPHISIDARANAVRNSIANKETPILNQNQLIQSTNKESQPIINININNHQTEQQAILTNNTSNLLSNNINASNLEKTPNNNLSQRDMSSEENNNKTLKSNNVLTNNAEYISQNTAASSHIDRLNTTPVLDSNQRQIILSDTSSSSNNPIDIGKQTESQIESNNLPFANSNNNKSNLPANNSDKFVTATSTLNQSSVVNASNSLDKSKQPGKESIITLDNSEDGENLRNEAQRSKCGADKSRLLLEERLNLSRIENLNNSTESNSITETKKRLASSNSTVEKIDPSNLKRNNNREGIIDQNINDQGTSASFATGL
jgi:hypothetical protein